MTVSGGTGEGEEVKGTGKGEVQGAASSEPAEPELEVAVAGSGAVFEEVTEAVAEDVLGEGIDPEGGESQDEQEAVDPVGSAQSAGLPLPAEGLEITEQLLLLGASSVLTTASGAAGKSVMSSQGSSGRGPGRATTLVGRAASQSLTQVGPRFVRAAPTAASSMQPCRSHWRRGWPRSGRGTRLPISWTVPSGRRTRVRRWTRKR